MTNTHGSHTRHDHSHTDFQPDIKEPKEDWEFLEITLRELLVDKGILSAREIQDEIEAWEKKSPEKGAEIVARAWVDEDFKARLLEDANQTIRDFGIEVDVLKMVALENTSDLHHVVVCTLCSCYPRPILGVPPLWYKSKQYRSRVVREPRAVLNEFGTSLTEDTEVRVVDSTADCRYLVIPVRPSGTENMTEQELAKLVTRDSMIGTAQALGPVGQRS